MGDLTLLCDGIKTQKAWGTFPTSGAIEFSNWVSREQLKVKTIHSRFEEIIYYLKHFWIKKKKKKIVAAAANFEKSLTFQKHFVFFF